MQIKKALDAHLDNDVGLWKTVKQLHNILQHFWYAHKSDSQATFAKNDEAAFVAYWGLIVA